MISNTRYFLIFAFDNIPFGIFTISIWIFSYFFRIVLSEKSVKNIHNYILKNPENKDVVGLMDKDGNIVVTYLYDAWGNIASVTGTMVSTLGVDNPFRYRG